MVCSIGTKDLQAANLDERLRNYENKLTVVTAGIASGFKIN